MEAIETAARHLFLRLNTDTNIGPDTRVPVGRTGFQTEVLSLPKEPTMIAAWQRYEPLARELVDLLADTGFTVRGG